MACAEVDVGLRPISFSVAILIDPVKLTEDVFTYLDNSREYIAKKLEKTKKVTFAHLRDVLFQEEMYIVLSFEAYHEEALENFYKSNEKLSEWFTDHLQSNLKKEITATIEFPMKYLEHIKKEYRKDLSRHQHERQACDEVDKGLETTPAARGNLKIIDETQSKRKMITKVLKLYVPFKENTVVKVNAIFDTQREVERVELHHTSTGIYTLSIRVPEDIFEKTKKITFLYEVTLKGLFINYKRKSCLLIMDDFEMQRDYWDRGFYFFDSVASHIEDIVFGRPFPDLNAAVKHIESFSTKHRSYIDNQGCKELLRQLTRKPEANINNMSAILIAVVVGNIFIKTPRDLQFVGPEKAKHIFAVLTHMQLGQLKETCFTYMPEVCLLFGKRALGDEFTMLSFMLLTYSVLGAEHLNNLFLKHMQHCVMLDENQESETQLEQLLKHLLQDLDGDTEVQSSAFELIQNITCKFPLHIVCHALDRNKHVISSVTSSCKDTFWNKIFVRCMTELKTAKCNGLDGVKKLWEAVSVIKMETLTESFEQEICLLIKASTNKSGIEKMVLSCCTIQGLFMTRESQLLLLETIAESRNNNIHQLLPVLVSQKEVETVSFDILDKWFKTLCNNILPGQKLDTQCEEVFKSYFSVISYFDLSDDEKEKMQTIVISFLERRDLKTVLSSMDKIESLCEDERQISACITILRAYVDQQQTRFQQQDVLDSFCTNGKLRINSRLTLNVVCLLIKIFCPTPQQNDQVEVLIEMLQRNVFWQTIFQSEGSFSEDLSQELGFQLCLSCIYGTVKQLESKSLTYKQYMRIVSHGLENVKNLLYCGKQDKMIINQLLDQYQSTFQEKRKHIAVVSDVLKVVFSHLESSLQTKLKTFVDSVKLIHQNFDQVSLLELYFQHDLIKEINTLIQPCCRLERVVKSKVFWNLNKIQDQIEWKEINEVSDDENEVLYLRDIRYIFGEIYEECSEESKSHSWFKNFFEKRSKMFSDSWREINENPLVKMETIRDMFHGVNKAMTEEFEIAETHLGYSLENDIKTSLLRLVSIREATKHVNAMVDSLEAFGIQLVDHEEFKYAVESFNRLRQDDILALTFTEASSCLQIAFHIEECLSKPTILILESIGNASSLVNFLRSIAEDDIRNLIDAVEDISEQHVTETTVSALIDVKRFCKPLLQPNFENNFESWMHAFQKQADLAGESVSALPFKIQDCMSNLHNLKSLYNNVANRGVQTKQIIRSIVRKGKFHFRLCPEMRTCDFEVSYKPERKQNTVRHSKASVNDYRSRAFLLMNKDKYKQESRNTSDDLDLFIVYVNLCSDISETAYQLHMSGHVDFKTYEKSVGFASLDSVKQELNKKLMTWVDDLKLHRKKYYIMNFFLGKHIHALHNFFEKAFDGNVVKSLIRFINPNLELKDIKTTYAMLKSQNPTDATLQLMGKTFHRCVSSLPQFKRTTSTIEDQKAHITEVIESGKPLVARIEEKSTLMVRTVLALFTRVMGSLPEANHVLFCKRNTDWNEIQLLLGRCLGADKFYGPRTLFCLTNIELLSSEIQLRLIEKIRNLHRKSGDFLLAIVCQCHRNHHLMDDLSDFVVPVRCLSEEAVRSLFKQECPSVHTYTSDIAGIGKTSSIFKQANFCGRTVRTLHVSGPIYKGKIVDRISQLNLQEDDYLHIDIGEVDNPIELDTILFELIVLKYLETDLKTIELPTDCVAVEIGNTIHDNLRNSLTIAVLFQRVHLKWNDYKDMIVSADINSPIQVVCHYLRSLNDGSLDKKDIYFTGKNAVIHLPDQECRMILRNELNSTSDTSFATVNIFLNLLADQLKKMSASAFFRTARISDMIGDKTLPVVRSTMVKALIEVAKEFSSRSVRAYRSTQQDTLVQSAENTDKSVETMPNDYNLAIQTSKRVNSMIRWDDSNHLIFVFHNQNVHTISPLYRSVAKVPTHIRDLFQTQLNKKLPDFCSLTQEQLQDMLQKISRVQPSLPPDKLQKLAAHYALTPDNLLKMVLIMMRIKAGIPVIVMGETGCGKTSLIRYLASICDIPFDVISIHAGVEETTLIEKIHWNNKQAFKDFNTERWVFFDEINTSESIGLLTEVLCQHRCLGKLLAPNIVFIAACNPYKLRSKEAIFTTGLKSKAQTDELSRLVYRVHPLPEKLVDYVWDFGSLTENDEKLYIERMVFGLLGSKQNEELLIDLLAMSQSYTRQLSGTTSCVSLRDVQRCKILLRWFIDVAGKKESTQYSTVCKSQEVKGIILTLAHCYQSRYTNTSERQKYRENMKTIFHKHKLNEYCEEMIHKVILDEQKDILARMELPPGTAENIALQENVFVLLVCIMTRIPIFLVGKPGCSKSLSMQVIKSNLRGKDSKDSFFKKLPQLYCVSFQGSESSTSDGILKVFEKAENYRKATNNDDVLSVVLLDEIGLAEISRFNPLKVLHSLLEPEGQSRPNVAVVGISNWCLDESKMNRAVHLSRPEMDLKELFETAVSISESFEKREMTTLEESINDYRFVASDIKEHLLKVASSYYNYIQSMRFESFHGLRDYYSLVKYVTRQISLMNTVPNKTDIQNHISRGVQRNFGGLPDEQKALTQAFDISECPNMSVTDLIKDNLGDEMARHILLITTGESVIGILEKELDSVNRTKREILFGSQFEEDLTDDYNYRILSRIILCMEQGIVLVLKDLENIYGSLYDMLNKNYTVIGNKQMCRVALGAYSNPFCHVHEQFKCIVLVDKKKLDMSDPPFLNRFEKHVFQLSDVLSKKQKNVIEKVEKWIAWLVASDNKIFSKEDCLALYTSDLVASLVLNSDKGGNVNEDDLILECQKELLHIVKPEVIVRLDMKKSSPSTEHLWWIRQFHDKLPLHRGLAAFIEFQLEEQQTSQLEQGMMTVVFTGSSLHSRSFWNLTSRSHYVENLGAFKSEKHLSLQMLRFWKESEIEILFLLCSAGHEKHIMLAKSIIERYRKEFMAEHNSYLKHVYMIVHVDKNNQSDSNITSAINYLSDWKLVMLDNIECPNIPGPELCRMTLQEAILQKRPLNSYIKEKFLWAFSKIKYPKNGRTVQSFLVLLDQMKHCEEFIEYLDEKVYTYILETQANIGNTNWQVKVAFDVKALKTSCTFIDALERYILSVIDTPLAKLVYKMEHANILDSFLIEDSLTTDRRKAWKHGISKPSVFSLVGVPDESGPESYICKNNEIFLKMPFSMYIFETIETTRTEFIKSVALLRNKSELDVDDDLPTELLSHLLSHQEYLILHKIPDLVDFVYSTDDYIHDFCNILSYTTCSNLDRDSRVLFMELVLQQNVDFKIFQASLLTLLTRLHACYWMNYRMFHGVLHLIEYCCSETDMGGKVKQYAIELHVPSQDVDIEDIEMQTIHQTISVDQEQSVPGDKSDKCNKKEQVDLDSQITTGNEGMDVYESVNTPDGISSEETDAKLNETCAGVVENLIDFVCKSMLPTEQVMKQTGLQNWKRRAHTVLTLVSNVSCEPEMVDKLRFCFDVCTQVVIPAQLDIKWLQQLSEIILDKKIDSPIALNALMKIADEVRDQPNVHQNCLKLVAKVSVRCLYRSPATPCIPLVLYKVQEGNISDDLIWIFKAPFQLALKLVAADQPELFMKLLEASDRKLSENSCDGNFQRTEIENKFNNEVFGQEKQENTKQGKQSFDFEMLFSDEYQNSDLLNVLSICLKQLWSSGNQCIHLSNMVVDLLAEIYDELSKESEGEADGDEIDAMSKFLQAHNAIGTSSGIQKLACIAYAKHFLQLISERLIELNLPEEIKQGLKAAFRPMPANEWNEVFLCYCLKLLGMNHPISLFYHRYILLQEIFGNDSILEWREDDFLDSFDICPLMAFLSTDASYVQSFFDLDDKNVPLENRVKMVISESKQSRSGRLILFAIAMKYFYLIRPMKNITDTRSDQAALFVYESQTQKLHKPVLVFIEQLFGKKDFAFDTFILQEGSQPLECILSGWFMTLLSLLLSSFPNNDRKVLPFMASCLLRPLSIQEMYIPGFRDSNVETFAFMDFRDKHSPFTCDCGHRLAIFTAYRTECKICKRDVPDTRHTVSSIHHNEVQKGYVIGSAEKSRVRCLSPVSSHILQLMIKGCLLGSLAIGIATREQLEQITNIGEVDVAEHLWKESVLHWDNLSKTLNVDAATTSLILTSVLLKTADLICKTYVQMDTANARTSWEKDFESAVQCVLSKPFSIVKDILQAFHKRKASIVSAELVLRESELLDFSHIPIPKEVELRSHFRLTGSPNELNFFQNVYSQTEIYPFLELVIRNREYLQLPKYVLSVVQWHMTVTSKVSYLMKKHEFLDMSIADFIRKFDDKRQLMKSRFTSFKTDWNNMRDSIRGLGLMENIERVHNITTLADTICIRETSIAYKVLEILVQIQNDFIDATLILGQSCDSVSFLCIDENTAAVPHLEIIEANKQNLIDIDFVLKEIVDMDAQCSLEYSEGRHVRYDLKSIERELAVQIIVGKAHIGFKASLPVISFTDELFRNYSSLVSSIKTSIPQERLPHHLQQSIKANHETDPKMATELLTHVGMVMTWLKKTKENSQRALVDFIDSWKTIFTDNFPKKLLPSPQNSLLLCHIVALHEILEELCSEPLLDSLGDGFRQELELESENMMKQLVQSQPEAAEILRRTLRRFAYRCLTLRDAESDTTIMTYLTDASFWPDGVKVDEGIRVNSTFIPMHEVIPEGLTVGQIYWTVATLENEFENEKDPKISKITSSYQSRNKPSDNTKDIRKKKILKGYKKKKS